MLNKAIRLIFLIYFIVLIFSILKIDNHMSITREMISESRQGGFYNINLKPLDTIKYDIQNNDLSTTFLNIIAFIPIGLLYPLVIFKNKRYFTYFIHFLLFDLLIEIIQFVAMIGYFDVDDILLNTIGFAIGYFLYIICKFVIKVKHSEDIINLRKANKKYNQ